MISSHDNIPSIQQETVTDPREDCDGEIGGLSLIRRTRMYWSVWAKLYFSNKPPRFSVASRNNFSLTHVGVYSWGFGPCGFSPLVTDRRTDIYH